MKKKGDVEIDEILKIMLWVVFFIIAGGAVYFFVRKLVS